ncbi:type I restriction endonuclease subunit R [Deinococcus psychrotolerans]|uniref:Type I restriction enzyme endonuclease subunit n=1 Tax=Deinococcus psychrotolerans TaxID=2489213 RepID=A0A3G8YKV7_9DEIO|nr:HsdR family type I site-specific deoxyribonuclease [Deinococcus psychrotolerans]AZI43214.1 type I restriction endonuclease subunit R [Deinococcus psychrotolerans]
MTQGREYNEVEFPFIGQLVGMGWNHLVGDRYVPAFTERNSFKETLLKGRLREALRRINAPEYPWLTDSHLDEALSQLTRLPAGLVGLRPVNAHLTSLLLEGVQVTGPDGKGHTLRFIDFRTLSRNDFLAINQFRIDPPGYVAGPGYIIPDVVLFVNGIPLVVVECKSPGIAEPMAHAVSDLLGYQNLRDSAEIEGVERFFHPVQLLVGTSFYKAVLGTVGAPAEEFLTWKDTYPLTRQEVQEKLDKPQLHPQQVLTAGVLYPHTLLDLLENFTLTDPESKRVARYQQYRAVHKALARLKSGETRLLGAEVDGRGGIVWHTQGSGKSLTMMFLVRALRTVPELRTFKIVVVTDRRDLERQLVNTAQVAGEPVTVAKGVKKLNTELAKQGTGFVFGMVQKLRGQIGTEFDPQQAVLNASPNILVLVDEAHRSHTNTQHAHLRAALPNAAMIGFTGTPIITGQKKKTHEIFGPMLDTYTLLESQEDKATVPILYEGRTVNAYLKDGQNLDSLFDTFFGELSKAARLKLQQKYGTLGDILESPRLIALKARDMLLHYASQVLPNGLKGQVVAPSRRAAVEYQRAFRKAQVELVDELEHLDSMFMRLLPAKLASLDEHTRALVMAYPYLDRLRVLEFAAVISADGTDPPEWTEWSDPLKQELRTGEKGQFKTREHPLSLLIVKSMLLTGFDAPVEQVLYLDRNIRNHELLQAIARVNRTHPGKRHGLVVDYYGVGHHLAQALSDYTQAEVQGVMSSIKDSLPLLDTAHYAVVSLFSGTALPLTDCEDCVNALNDSKLRAEFKVKLNLFLNALDTVLPRPEALRYVEDAALLSRIQSTARQVYQDGDEDEMLGAGEKVRALIAQYVDVSAIQVKVPPIEVLNPNFSQQVGGYLSKQTQAAAMEHAAKHFITLHADEDPVYYQKLSEKLEELLKLHAQHWDALVSALKTFIGEVQTGRPADTTGLNPLTEAPLFSLLLAAQAAELQGLSEAQRERLIEGTVTVVQELRNRTVRPDFWRNAVQQKQVKGWLFAFLDQHDLVPYDACAKTADELMNLAKHLYNRWSTPQ